MFILPHLKGLVAGNVASAAFKSATLDLKFAANKSLVDSISGSNLITFNRAAPAGSSTYVGSDGLIKTAVTNLLLRSEEFDNASWTGGALVITANTQAAPNGTITADTLTASSGTPNFYQVLTCTASTSYTFSFYVKLGTMPASDFKFAVRDDTAGVFIATDITPNVTPVTTEWRRVSYTFTTPVGCVLVRVYPYRFTVVTGGTAFLWGAQLEQASTVGDYIQTTSAINSAPRFTHDPTTSESLGLLGEEARTNLLLQSENLLTTWTANGGLACTANQTVSPNGSTTADLLAGGGTLIGYLEQPNASSNQFVSGTTYTYSIYLKKANTSTCLTLLFGTTFNSGGGNPIATWNLDTGVPTFINGATGSMTAVGNGWYRCVVTDTATQTHTQNQQWLRMPSASGDVYAWGAQLEVGAFATSYIPTTTATVTRAVDVASITGSNFSSFYNQTEGTVFAEGQSFDSRTTDAIMVATIDDGSLNNEIQLSRRLISYLATCGVTAGGAAQADMFGSAWNTSSNGKLGVGLAVNNSAISFNGASVVTDTSISLPTVTTMRFGRRANGFNAWNGTIKRLTYWPTRLSNTTLQQITQL
jgi:hypothetical protein